MSAVTRLHQPGEVLDGYVLQDGDCLSHAPFEVAVWTLCPDDGQPDSGTLCGFADDEGRICPAAGAFTAWFHACGLPTALCAGHAAIVRDWPQLQQMHTVRAAGDRASWVGGAL